MRLCRNAFALVAVWASVCTQALAREAKADQPRSTMHDGPTRQVSVHFFAALERLARLVDISYCVGTTGVSSPFSCVSRCKEFPSLDLVTTWNTGMLLSDSCGYIAVDHGEPLLDGIPHDEAAEKS